ncbi:protein NDH-DEPENDENT CYCLIC ELECTRON FLOW 5 [Solanum tuberosum]|uniref:Aldose 1-epimerase family protein n=2 Tax=Solanum tuberosum TaxID=4113 RepID=M1AGG6_SOLTU|nr:PREDICTED: protein NDH-DEPENDENT CYCLIC ELECTRON FLOW 5 [Solanum tuberosum]
MAAINTCLLSTNVISGSPISRSPSKSISTFPTPPLCSPLHYSSLTRNIQLPGVASISYPPIDTEYLESEFSGHGVTFTEVNESCVVRMALENGSIANLMLPSGLITSYKAQMWHGGTMELLHTTVSEGQNGSPVIEGGVSLACNCENDEGFSWSPSSWALHQVKGDPQGSIQVELICTSSDGKIEAKYMVTLQEDLLTSEIKIFNLGMASFRMTGSVLSHLTVSTPEASYAVGLQGSDFFSNPPFLANFSIIPPAFGKTKNQPSKKSFGEIFSSWGTKNQNPEKIAEKELEGEETDNYKHLTDEMSKLYKSAPRNFTLIDRGRRNSVVVGRDGFKEVYLLSPGSRHESYGRYSYICVGQAALLQPIIIESQSEWRGKQSLHNPNM